MSQSAHQPTASETSLDAPRTTVGAVPDWLTPDFDPTVDTRPESDTRKALRHREYEVVFETFLDRVAEGMTIKRALDLEQRDTDFKNFMRWVITSHERRERFYEAQAIGAEWIADEIVEIADAEDSVEDVARSTLRINARKWIAGTRNRKRFGETKQVEQNVTIDLGNAMIEAQERAERFRNQNIIDITPRLAND